MRNGIVHHKSDRKSCVKPTADRNIMISSKGMTTQTQEVSTYYKDLGHYLSFIAPAYFFQPHIIILLTLSHTFKGCGTLSIGIVPISK